MFNRIANGIDAFINKQGELTSLLVLPLLFVVIYEVFMRYVLNAPTIWGFETTTFLYGIHYMFGLSYTDRHNAHVKVDIFTSRAPKKTQALLGAITTIVIFLPAMTCLTIWSFKYALTSLLTQELNSTSWAPPVYPFKIIMALTLAFLLLQGISNLIRDLRTFFDKSNTAAR